MYKVKFSLVRTIELQSWQEVKLTDEQAKELKELENNNDKYQYLSNLEKINYDNESEDDVLEIEIQDLKIRKIKGVKND